MTDMLAILEDSAADERVVEEIVRRHPDRVTLLLEGSDGAQELDDSSGGSSRQARLTALRAAIERTGAVVVGLAGSREQLRGWRFDRIVGASGPTTAF